MGLMTRSSQQYWVFRLSFSKYSALKKVAMKILIVLFGISLFFKGLQSIVYRKSTTYSGIAETRIVFTKFAAFFWGICLVILSSVVLLWATIPQYFQNPIFKVGNVLLAYVVAYILAWVIQLFQRNASR